MLMREAERISRDEHKSHKLAVISGVGTRNYYRKLGYELEGPYMCINLLRNTASEVQSVHEKTPQQTTQTTMPWLRDVLLKMKTERLQIVS
jgi:hypothetical protein